jgi:hypothetical protein
LRRRENPQGRVVDSSQIAEMITFIQPPRRSRGFPSSSEEGSFDVSFFYATWYNIDVTQFGFWRKQRKVKGKK